MNEYSVKYNGFEYTVFAKDRNDLTSKMARKLGCTCRDLNHKLEVRKKDVKKRMYYVIDCDKNIVFHGKMNEICNFLNIDDNMKVGLYVHKCLKNNEYVMTNGYILSNCYNINYVLENHDFKKCKEITIFRRKRRTLNMKLDRFEVNLNLLYNSCLGDFKKAFYEKYGFRLIESKYDKLFYAYDDEKDISFLTIKINDNGIINVLGERRKSTLKYYYDKKLKELKLL